MILNDSIESPEQRTYLPLMIVSLLNGPRLYMSCSTTSEWRVITIVGDGGGGGSR